MRRQVAVKFLGTMFLILAAARASHSQNIPEERRAVVFLFGVTHPVGKDNKPLLDDKNQPLSVEMPLGTGFFVGYPDPRGGPTYAFCYLVTAKHVLRDFDKQFLRSVKIRLNRVGGKDADFIEDVPVSDQTGKLLWYSSPDEAVDLAVAPLLPDQRQFDFTAVSLSMFVDDATIKSNSVGEGDSLYFIGLLAQFYGVHHNYPVVRRGTLAMMTDELLDTETGKQKEFIAELQSWPGNSGSPVFLNLSGLRGTGNLILGGQDNLKLLGVLEGVFNNQVPLSVVGHPEIHPSLGNDAPVGVSLIIPATRLREIVELPELRRRRDVEVERYLKTKQ